jgi:hypothetical protein
MFDALLIGCAVVVANMAIQVIAALALVRFLVRRLDSMSLAPGLGADIGFMSTVVFFLFVGHLLQFATWALIFVWLGQFTDFQTAFYHSAVNFTSLGYGDIVMDENWRLLGALEAANGVLMFGLTAGTMLSVMNRLFTRHKALADSLEKLGR